MAIWNEAEHPRDDEGKFTEKGSGVSAEEKYKEKMQRRADILYDRNAAYIKKYYGSNKETDIIKRMQDMALDDFENNIYYKLQELSYIMSKNGKFSDSELQRARDFIHNGEGFRNIAYRPTPNDVLTIGYGHTGKVDGKPIKEGMVITRAKAEELYRKDFEAHTTPLKDIRVPLTSNQKIALASLIYNIGVKEFTEGSKIPEKLNAGDYKGAADRFDVYVKQTNKQTKKKEVLKGLVNRRKREKELFLTPDGE
ncbi:MAG: lysozyme [Candidatus Gastranaerophilales bacterium]|nr:lysozyme [Candidatus Gastranaerophilales bacterium]